MTIQRNRPEYTSENKSTWNDSDTNTLTPILTLPAACTQRQTHSLLGWNRKKDGSKKTRKCRNTGSLCLDKPVLGQGGGGVLPWHGSWPASRPHGVGWWSTATRCPPSPFQPLLPWTGPGTSTLCSRTRCAIAYCVGQGGPSGLCLRLLAPAVQTTAGPGATFSKTGQVAQQNLSYNEAHRVDPSRTAIHRVQGGEGGGGGLP